MTVEKEMVCKCCGAVDDSFTAYCIKCGRVPHSIREVTAEKEKKEKPFPEELRHYLVFVNHEVRYACMRNKSLNGLSRIKLKDSITNDYFEITCEKCKKLLDEIKPKCFVRGKK